MYRYTRKTIHKTRHFRVPCSDLQCVLVQYSTCTQTKKFLNFRTVIDDLCTNSSLILYPLDKCLLSRVVVVDVETVINTGVARVAVAFTVVDPIEASTTEVTEKHNEQQVLVTFAYGVLEHEVRELGTSVNVSSRNDKLIKHFEQTYLVSLH